MNVRHLADKYFKDFGMNLKTYGKRLVALFKKLAPELIEIAIALGLLEAINMIKAPLGTKIVIILVAVIIRHIVKKLKP